MHPPHFTSTLLRASAGGFASMAVSQTVEHSSEPADLGEDFAAWQAHFQSLVLELAAAVEDGGKGQFASQVGWVRDAFAARGLATKFLSVGLGELCAVLKNSLPEAAFEPLPEFFEAARSELDHPSTMPTGPDPGDDPLEELVRTFLSLVQAGEGARAIAGVLEAIREGRLSVPDALDRVLIRALQETGRLWHANRMNVAEEHYVSQTTSRLLEQIVLMAPKAAANGKTALLSMVEGDAHDLGLRIVSAFFELEGWRTICLGSNTPAADLAQSAETFDADLLVLGATLSTQRESVRRTIQRVRTARPKLAILIGGPAFTDGDGSWKNIGADACALDPREAVRLGTQLAGKS